MKKRTAPTSRRSYVSRTKTKVIFAAIVRLWSARAGVGLRRTSVAPSPPASSPPPPSQASCRRSASASPADTFMGFLADFFGALVSAAAPPTLLRNASTRSTTFSPSLLRHDRLARTLAVDQIDEGGLVVVLELVGSKRPLFWFTMCFARSSMFLVTLTSWISSKSDARRRTVEAEYAAFGATGMAPE
jgi:hypothetical protein